MENNKKSPDTVVFPRWALVLIGIGIITWIIISMMPKPERTYRIEGTIEIETQVEIQPLSP